MSLPVGMSSPVAAPAFKPISPSPQSTQQAPMMSAPSPYRQRGYATNPMTSLSDEPYVPPVWARTINVSDPSWTQPGQQAGAAAQNGYTPPGVPERFQVNPFGDDPIRSFLGDQNTQSFLGMAPAPGQRGGSYYGLATAPITLANFTPWGREGLLALALSVAGSGDDWTPKEGAQFGQQPTGPEDGGGPVDWFTRGAQAFGDVAWKAIDAPMKWFRDSNAFNRAKSVRNLFQSGDAHPVIGSELITTAIFGGKERFTMEAIQRVAAQQGIDYIDLMAKWYDFSPSQVAMIAANPFMNDDALGKISDGTPLSNDMLSNLALEGGMLLATMAIGGSGLARGATALGKAGLESVGAFGAGVRGAQLAAGASRGLSAARAMGTITRRAMQLNSMNTVAGWSIRGAELGIKQLAIIAGNDELVNAMDRLLWVQPLSMNPGWQLLDGFTAHPIDTYRNLRHGQVSIGRPTSPGYVGQLDLKGLAVRGSDGQVMTLDILGRKVTLGPESEEFKVLGKLRDLTPEQMHESFFKRLGWSMEDMNLAFGEGNPYNRTWDDVRNGLFHVALEAVRESKGQLGRLEGVDLPTYALRTAAFVRNNAKGALKMLDRNLTGESDEMVRLFKSDFWDLAKRNDTTMGELKAYLGDAYDPAQALADFGSWIRASKIVRDAIASRVARQDAVPAYRRTVNREFVAAWRNRMVAAVGPDEVVPLSAINQLKRLGGAIELRGRGSELVRGRRSTYTRKQLEDILDDVEREDDLWQRRSNQAPHTQAAAYRKGVDPGQDPLEDARVAGLSPADVQTIQRVTGGSTPPTSLPPPHLLAKVAKATGRTADGLRALGPEGAWKAITDWFDTRLASAADTARQRDALDNAAATFEGRAASGRMAPAAAHQAAVALRRIRDELLAPLDEKVAKNRPGLWQTWDVTRQEALILASELETHLADPLARFGVARNVPGQEWVLPPNVGQDALKAWADLAERIAAYAPVEGDRALLLDQTIHPFSKTEVMKRSVGGTDEAELARLSADIGGAPDEVLIAALNDLEPRAPGDPPHTLSEVDGLNGRVIGYERAGDDLAARAGQVARRFDNLGGAWSDEMQATMDRVWAHAPKYKAAQPKGAQRNIMLAEMDPDAPGRAAARETAKRVAEADRKVAEAAAKVARAQRAVDDPATYVPPTVAEVENLTWTDLPGGTFDEGVDAVKKRAADQFAAEYRRNNPGSRVWVENRKKPNRYVVRVASPAREAAPAPIPGSRALKPYQQADAVRQQDRLYGENAKKGLANDDFEDESILQEAIADPRVADADLAALKEYVTKEKAAIEADLAKNRPHPAPTDWRNDLLAIMDARLAAFEKRSQSRLEEAAVAPDAAPETIAARDQGRLDMGGTPESGGAVTADVTTRTQGGLEAMRQAEAPVETPALVGSRGTFQDPRTEAERPIEYELRVVEASTLVNSWDEGYPLVLQNRDKRINDINRVAARPDTRLLKTEEGALGTPVLLSDGRTVIAGNHRAEGIRVATDAAYAELKNALVARARDFGVEPGDVAGMDRPVLVRVITDPNVGDATLANALNKATGGLSAENTARTINDAFTPADWRTFQEGAGTLDQVLAKVGNLEFFRRIQRILPESERSKILRTSKVDGKDVTAPTPEAIGIAKAAILGKVLGDPGAPIVGDLALAVGKKDAFASAVGNVAADLADVVSKMESGSRPIVDIQNPLRDALQLAMNAPDLDSLAVRSELDQWLSGVDGTDPVVASLAKELIGLANDTEAPQKSLTTFLRGIAEAIDALPDPTAPVFDLFGAGETPPAPSFTDIANRAVKAWNDAADQADVAAGRMVGVGHRIGLIAEPGGQRIIRDGTGAQTGTIHPAPIESTADAVDALKPAVVDDLILEADDWADAARHIGTASGRITLRVDTPAEAERMIAYLGGDDSAILPAEVRVTNGVVEALPGAAATRVRRLLARANLKDSYKAEIGRYLDWVDNDREGPDPGVSERAAKWVDSRIKDKTGEPITNDPDLPGLRKALEGREYEVRVVGEAPAPVLDEAAAPRPTGYFNGDQFEYLGTSQEIHGGTFYDVLMLEGKDAGTQKVVKDPPPAAEAPAPAAPPVTIVSRKGRRLVPEQPEITGVDPASPIRDMAARSSADAGEHRIVPSGDAHTDRAERAAAGAPIVDDGGILVRNTPDQTGVRAIAEAALAKEQAALEAAQQARARLGEAPADVPPPADILQGAELDLWHRYTSDSSAIARPPMQPQTVGQVVHALESLDLDLPPLVATMTESEMRDLRGALYRVLHSRLTELGADAAPPPNARPPRTGPGVTHTIGTARMADDEILLSTPEDMSADFAEVMGSLQGRVFESDDPLAGWEGTQYEIGALPVRGRDGGPLSPRIQYDDWVNRLDEVVPGLGDEVLHGRKQTWQGREEDHRFTESLRTIGAFKSARSLWDTAFGARPEKDIVRQAIDRFTKALLKDFKGDQKAYDQAVRDVHTIIGALHEHMRLKEIAKFPKYRRIGLVPADQFEDVARKAFGGMLPDWLNTYVVDAQKAGIQRPIAEAWRVADNRVRAYFAERPGGMADWINHRYDSWYGRAGHAAAQKLSVGYVVYRFLIDARWLGLEAIDAPVLTFFREGPGAALEGLQKGRQKLPLFMDATEAEAMRNNWAWWMANSDVGTMLRQRERYVLGIARRYQDQEFPRAVAAYMRAMERIGTDMPEMQQALRMNGHTPMEWLRELDADWQLGMKRGRPLDPGEAEKLFGPWRTRKAADGGPVISQKEYDEFVKANRWTGHPRLEAELAYLADPRLQPLMERLAVINEQGWNDAAKLVFGQTDRSNAQRLANHPLLYWPISYQIKATKWLAGLLFDRAFGYDTGSVGAVTLGQLHQMHKDRMANDPEYASTVVNNPTLLFAASMLFPIAPWEIGVSLSPMTRLALSMATNDDPAEAYRRNVFAMGPGYTYFNLLPRLLYEQSKPGSWAQGAGIVGDVVQRAQYLAPYSVPVAPKSRSQLESANAAAYTGMPPQPAPFTPPVAKQQ